MSGNNQKLAVTSFYLAKNVHKVLKLMAIHRDTTVSKVVSNILNEYIAQYTLENPEFNAMLKQSFVDEKEENNPIKENKA